VRVVADDRPKGGGQAVPIRMLAFSSDGSYLLSPGTFGTEAIRKWDVNTGKPVPPPFKSGAIVYASLSANFKTIAIAVTDGDKSPRPYAKVIDVETGKELARLTDYPITYVCLSPDGKTVVTTHFNKSKATDPNPPPVMWNVKPSRRGELTGGKVVDLDYWNDHTFSPDSKLFVCAGDRNKVLVWDVSTRRLKTTLRHPEKEGNVVAVAFRPEGKVLATTAVGVTFWDVVSGKQLARMYSEGDPIVTLAFTPDGKTLATGAASGKIRLWDASGVEKSDK
jgi:WD40 repeat protein